MKKKFNIIIPDSNYDQIATSILSTQLQTFDANINFKSFFQGILYQIYNKNYSKKSELLASLIKQQDLTWCSNHTIPKNIQYKTKDIKIYLLQSIDEIQQRGSSFEDILKNNQKLLDTLSLLGRALIGNQYVQSKNFTTALPNKIVFSALSSIFCYDLVKKDQIYKFYDFNQKTIFQIIEYSENKCQFKSQSNISSSAVIDAIKTTVKTPKTALKFTPQQDPQPNQYIQYQQFEQHPISEQNEPHQFKKIAQEFDKKSEVAEQKITILGSTIRQAFYNKKQRKMLKEKLIETNFNYNLDFISKHSKLLESKYQYGIDNNVDEVHSNKQKIKQQDIELKKTHKQRFNYLSMGEILLKQDYYKSRYKCNF